MINIKSILITLCFGLFFLAQTSFSEPTGKVNLDRFFRYQINFQKLTLDKDKVALNLMAQMKDPKATTNNVNDFDQFIAVGNLRIFQRSYSLFSTFNSIQMITNRTLIQGVFTGAVAFNQQEIPAWPPFQWGFNLAKICFEKQGIKFSDKMARFIIFRMNIEGAPFTYDYVMRDDDYPIDNKCREYLYFPDTKTCDLGMRVPCHFDLKEGIDRNSSFQRRVKAQGK